MKYLRTDIYDIKENGEIDYSSEIREDWGSDYEAAVSYLVQRGADETELRAYGITGNGEKSFSVCVWEDEECENCPEWLDNASEKRFAEHFGEIV